MKQFVIMLSACTYNTFMNAVECIDVVKNYGKNPILKGCSFCIEPSSFTVLTGANGAGKSTLFQILCGALSFDGGSVCVCGFDPARQTREMKRKLGVVFQNHHLDDALTLHDNLYYRAKLYGLSGKEIEKKIRELSQLLENENLLFREYKKLSGGEKRKADLQRAMIHQPSLLLLDEPTVGLDEASAREFIRYLIRLKKKGVAVLMISHDAAQTWEADAVLRLDGGVIQRKKMQTERGKRRLCVWFKKGSQREIFEFDTRQAIAFLHAKSNEIESFTWLDSQTGETVR